MPKLSIYRNAHATKGFDTSFDEVVQRIRTGAKGLDEKTKWCNILAQTDPPKYKTYKSTELPAVTFSGTFTQRNAKSLDTHSGKVTLDIDGLDDAIMPDLLVAFSQMPEIELAFVSPSSKGIKAVVQVDPVPIDANEHEGAYEACIDYFKDFATEYEFKIDTSGKDCSRLCFLAYHSNAIVRENPKAIEWDKAAWQTEQEQRRTELESRDWDNSEIDVTALDFIDPNTLEYEDWFRIVSGCKTAGLTIAQVDLWSRRGNRYREGEVENRWEGITAGKVTWGTIVWTATKSGYVLPPTKRKRYAIDTSYEHVTSDMDTEQEANISTLEKWLQETEQAKGKHLLVLGSAAGTGKTTATVTTAERLLYIAKTTEEADNVYEKLVDKGEDAYRHRSRLFNRDRKDWNTLPIGLGENDRPCAKPELCNLHAKRVGTAFDVCAQCVFHSECTDYGYLSQKEKERKASKVIYAWGEIIACDERYAERVKQICSEDDILTSDEVNPLALTQARAIDRDTLYDLTERFRHSHAETINTFKILEKLCDLISTAKTTQTFIDGLKDWIDSIEDIKALDEKFQGYPVGIVFHKPRATAEHKQPFEATLIYQNQEVTVPVVDFEIGDDTPAYFVDPEQPIETDTYEILFKPYSFLLSVGLATLEDPPIRHRKFLADIKTFFDENANIENAPFTFDPKHLTFDFHLKPTLNHRRVIFNTASDPDNLIGEAYRETEINITRHTGTPPAWKPNLTFQIETGNYLPRHSLIESDGENLKLKHRAQELVDDFILPSITARLKTLVVAPKAFQEVESVKEWAVTEMEDYQTGRKAMLINHHHAEGRNDFQDFDIVFVFHYEPNHHEIQDAAKRIYRNAEPPLSFEREKRKVTQGGVSFEKNAYTDNRVQQVYDRECRARLMQSPMRLRPNRNEGKIIVFLTAEPVDIPITPIAFQPQDAKHFTGDWTAFAEKLHAIATAEASGDVQAVIETKGVAKTKAYETTKQARQREKAERDAEIIRLHNAGKSQREIKAIVGCGLATINSVITAFGNSAPAISTSYSACGKTEHPTNLDDTGLDSEKSIIDELNAGNFDRLVISEKLAIDIELVRTVLGELLIVDPRLTAETQQRLKTMHQNRRLPALPQAHERTPPLIPPEELIPPEDWEHQIDILYRDGKPITAIAEAVRMTEQMVLTHISEQAF